MKILIDINHPAHVHYFRNFIKMMEAEGHVFIVTHRDHPLINELLNFYKIDSIKRGKRPKKQSTIRSFLYLMSMIRDVFRVSKKYKPDIFLGFASPACAVNAYLFKKTSIIIDDTEHNRLNHSIYSRFCSVILTPDFFEKDMGAKQIRFCAYVEQFYLHSNYFKPNKILPEDEYALIRYISYDASHDRKVKEVASESAKENLVRSLSKRLKVYVSSEGELPNNSFLKQFELKIHPSDIHSVIANASVFISEGATMASEAGVIGTPYFYINPLEVGYINHQKKHYKHANSCDIHSLLEELDSIHLEKDSSVVKSIELETIDPTEFLILFVKNYNRLSEKLKGTMVDRDEMLKLVHDAD